MSRGRDLIALAVAAELVGIGQRVMELAIEYAKDRQQFGRPIGAYQAVSHRCAQMLLETEGARSATLYAAWTADHEPESLQLAASMAKSSSPRAWPRWWICFPATCGSRSLLRGNPNDEIRIKKE